MTCTQEQFERDVAGHVMTIARDDGADRHIKFRAADGGSPCWFEILTWPGTLCIRGDCGTYVFSRLADMFEFFRTDDRGDPSKLHINRSYWCEKLQAVDCNGYGAGQAKEFSQENFAQHVKERFESYLESYEVTDEKRTQLWIDIEREILDRSHDGETRAFDALMEFHDDQFPRMFEDCWEWDCKEYTFNFIWNLYAIAWAIRTYDAARAATEAA